MAATGRATPTVLFIDRSSGDYFRSGKKHRADHSVLPDSDTVWARLTAAAAEASRHDAGALLKIFTTVPAVSTRGVAVSACPALRAYSDATNRILLPHLPVYRPPLPHTL